MAGRLDKGLFASSAALAVVFAFLEISCNGGRVPSAYPDRDDLCSMSPAQVRTLADPIAKLPVKVSVDAGWKRGEMEVIEDAIAVWNDFAVKSLGRPLFEVEPMQPIEPVCLNDMDELHKFCDSDREGLWIIPVLTDYHWKSMGFDQWDLGATKRCSTGRDGEPPKVVVVVNWTEKRGSILGSVALHELGHVIGLKHTCSHGHGGDQPQCSHLGDDHPYMMSVMAPNFYVNAIRHCQDRAYYSGAEMSLSGNDVERAFCLYRE